MKNRLQHLLGELDALERSARTESPMHRLDARAKLLATTAYLAAMLSLPLSRLSEILLCALFPMIGAAMGGMRLGPLVRRSLAVLPFVALIGIFNLLAHRTPALRIGPLTVTEGGIEYAAILLRGILSLAALLVLIGTTGFYPLCRAMQRLGIPRFLTVQLLFVYRYLRVLLDEALCMMRACEARSYGRRHLPLRVWGMLTGQLLLRTFDRAEQIHRAMLARGFTGRIPDCTTAGPRWRRTDTLFLAGWSLALLLIRLTSPAETLTRLLL
ncbi:MAG: cobalt ECF transporter T component CbiQ [Alistipes sp.]|nr:cobalt ECF transporter T component CbiQ [Alistipes sp.]